MARKEKAPEQESIKWVGRDATVLTVAICDSLLNRVGYAKVNRMMMGPLTVNESDLLIHLLTQDRSRAIKVLKEAGNAPL